jgi:DNA-binding transcriptional LysR family regulator
VRGRWPGIELRHLTALAAVAAEGSFSRAARRLGYTPSAVSHQIASLERIVGHALLNRGLPGGPVSLTEAGRVLQEHVWTIMGALAAARRELEAVRDEAEGLRIRVGIFESAGARLVPELVRRFAAHFPDARLEFEDASSDLPLFEALDEGEIELAFGVLPLPDHRPYAAVEIMADPFLFAAARERVGVSEQRRPLPPLELERLKRKPLVCFRSCRSTNAVLGVLRAGGVEPAIAFRSDQNETLLAAAEAGVGIALVPRLGVTERPGVRLWAAPPELPKRVLVLAWLPQRELSRPARIVTRLAQEVGAAVASDEEGRLPVAAAGGKRRRIGASL